VGRVGCRIKFSRLRLEDILPMAQPQLSRDGWGRAAGLWRRCRPTRPVRLEPICMFVGVGHNDQLIGAGIKDQFFSGPPSRWHPIPRSRRPVCSLPSHAPTPAITAPWNPPGAEAPPAGFGSAAEKRCCAVVNNRWAALVRFFLAAITLQPRPSGVALRSTFAGGGNGSGRVGLRRTNTREQNARRMQTEDPAWLPVPR